MITPKARDLTNKVKACVCCGHFRKKQLIYLCVYILKDAQNHRIKLSLKKESSFKSYIESP